MYFFKDTLFARSFPVYGTVVLPVTSPPHPTLLDSRASFFLRRGGSSGVDNACIAKKKAIPNKQDLSHSCFLSFFYSSNITSRISVTLVAIQLKR